MEWVLHGDKKPADPEENTYPLPHNAYSQRPLANKQQPNQEENTETADSLENNTVEENSVNSVDTSHKDSKNQSMHLTQADTKNANTSVPITDSEIDAFFNKWCG